MVRLREVGGFESEQELSQEELGPKVRELFSDLREALEGNQQFLQAAGMTYLSRVRRFSAEVQGEPVAVRFDEGLSFWTVRYSFGSYSLALKSEVLTEHLNIRHDRRATGEIRIVDLRIPFVGKDKEKADVEVSYDQTGYLNVLSPTRVRQKNTASAIVSAEQMLADLKAIPKS